MGIADDAEMHDSTTHHWGGSRLSAYGAGVVFAELGCLAVFAGRLGVLHFAGSCSFVPEEMLREPIRSCRREATCRSCNLDSALIRSYFPPRTLQSLQKRGISVRQMTVFETGSLIHCIWNTTHDWMIQHSIILMASNPEH